MIKYVYGKSMDSLKVEFSKIWGIYLLSVLLILLANIVGILPVISIPVIAVLTASVSVVYLNKINGQSPTAEDLFLGFKNVWHVALGMCWMYLWIFIWALIPIAGPIVAIVKMYSYRFTPYILIKEPDTKPTDALKKSISMTNGYRSKMFFADFIIAIGIVLVMLILSGLGFIRGVGGIFFFIEALFIIATIVFVPVFMGLVQACFYQEVFDTPEGVVKTYQSQPQAAVAPIVNAPENENPVNTATNICPKCGKANGNDAMFCANCGEKLK